MGYDAKSVFLSQEISNSYHRGMHKIVSPGAIQRCYKSSSKAGLHSTLVGNVHHYRPTFPTQVWTLLNVGLI